MKKLLFLALIVLSFGCGKNDDTIPDPQNMDDPQDTTQITTADPGHLLRKSFMNGELFSERFYNEDSILTHIDYYNDGELTSTTQYVDLSEEEIQVRFYSSSGNLLSYRNTYLKNDSTVHVDRYDNMDNFKTLSKHSYSSSDCGYYKLEISDENGELVSRYDNIFTDDNCSNTTEFFDTNLQTTEFFETIRDDKKVNYQFALLDLLRVNQLGSIKSYKAWNADGDLLSSNSYNAMIVYNDDDEYPISRTETYLDGNVIEYTYEY